jgi:hypothetical protein
MEARCCGAKLENPLEDFGCVACGEPCCSVCGVVLESVMYCAPCAGLLLELPPERLRR